MPKIEITTEKLYELAMLADWQLRQQGIDPASVTAAVGQNPRFYSEFSDEDQLWYVFDGRTGRAVSSWCDEATADKRAGALNSLAA